MQASYNLWLVGLSIVVAMVVSYTALKLAARVAEGRPSTGRMWLLGGAARSRSAPIDPRPTL